MSEIASVDRDSVVYRFVIFVLAARRTWYRIMMVIISYARIDISTD